MTESDVADIAAYVMALPPIANKNDPECRGLAETGPYRTAVGHPLFRFTAEGLSGRVVPGNPDASGVVFRMSRRGPRLGMPPVGTEVVDREGVEAVRAWVASLRPSITSSEAAWQPASR